MADATVVLDRDDMRRTLVRVAHEIVEKNPPPPEIAAPPPPETPAAPPAETAAAPQTAPAAAAFALVGIHRRGAVLAQRLKALTDGLAGTDVPLGFVDISFYRDDLQVRRDRDAAFAPGQLAPIVHATQLEFPIDGQRIVIVDDVLYTGRTVRAAIDAILDYGRPAQIQLATLIDRGHRELPIRPDFVGKNLPTARDQRVNVHVEELDGIDEVTLGPARTLGRSAA